MNNIQDFDKMDFIEQVELLNEIEETRDKSAIPGLFDLLQNPLEDLAMNAMARNCLRSVLLDNPDEAVLGLDSTHPAIVQMCADVVGELAHDEAAPKLAELAAAESDSDVLLDLLRGLSRLKANDHLEVFRSNLRHPDPLIAGHCIKAVGEFLDAESLPTLMDIVAENEADDRFETCDVTTWNAITSLGDIGSPEALEFLVKEIHHRNPMARRMVHSVLVEAGPKAIENVASALFSENEDFRIMACNILGFIGDRKACAHIVDAMDQGRLNSPNMRFAAYESLGRSSCMKGLICLLDALSMENDPFVLMSVATALEQQNAPHVLNQIGEMLTEFLDESPDRAAVVPQALVMSRTVGLLKELYSTYPNVAKAIVDRAASSRDPEIILTFRNALAELPGEKSAEDVKRLNSSADIPTSSRILAVDDSNAMLNFYRSAGAELGFEVLTAENGKNALELLAKSPDIDMIIVDMNMPVMDGIEMTKRVREQTGFDLLPIIMATTESEKSQATLAQKAGVSSFLRKPFTIDLLQNKIKNVLS